jgi:hypothetical protein
MFHSIRSFLQEKHFLKNSTIDNIWWKTYYNSFSKLNLPEQTIIFKFIHDRLPNGARDHKYYNFRDKQCPQCQCDSEDEDHILQCYSIKRRQARAEWLKEISDYLLQNHTPIGVKQLIMRHLLHWLEPTANTINTHDKVAPELQKVLKQQMNIGWKHFSRGRLSIEWGNIIIGHLENEKITNISAEKWGADLLHINWKHIVYLKYGGNVAQIFMAIHPNK